MQKKCIKIRAKLPLYEVKNSKKIVKNNENFGTK